MKYVQRQSRGFTLIELLVVIAIIAVLVALLLPAVQQARESARRSQCKNNLKQLGLALMNYEGTTGAMAYNYGGNNAYNSTGTGTSWLTLLLPYADQAPLYETMSPGSACSVDGNTFAAQKVITAFLCPSDAGNGNGVLPARANMTAAYTTTAGISIPANSAFGVTNYKAVAGNNWGWGNYQNTCAGCGKATNNNGLDNGNGLICRNGGNNQAMMTRMRDITDGTTNTFAVGEALPGRCTHNWWYWFNGTTATCSVPLNYYSLNTAITTGDWGNNYSFASLHTGGGHFTMADGSVRFVSENIDLSLYRDLASINGNELSTLGE